MKLGIVGLPNVGKSTLFNSLTKAGALSANYPFATIDPNVGIVSVPDERIVKLGELYHTKKVTPATIEFVDIAGLVRGAANGEGLGNKFLSHIREVDAIIHVVRCFEDGEIVHVDATLIESLLDGGFIPVIATVGMDDLGQAYNINADTAAAQIAIALKAEKLVSMTDIAGLLRDKEDETTLIPEVEVTEIEGYKSAGIIAGGMIPKIGGMADAIYQGVHEAVIIDGRVPHSILLELFSDRGSGTRFYRRSHRE